jgi:DNA-binding NarL/FixJ family response regulator
MKVLLIMDGRSFLKDALIHFLQSELTAAEVIAIDDIDQLTSLGSDERAAVRLVVYHIGHQDAQDRCVQSRIARARSIMGAVPFVLLGDRDEPAQSAAALRCGANGYISSSVSAEVMRHALPLVAEGGVFAPPYLFGVVSPSDAPSELQETPVPYAEPAALPHAGSFTHRELEVLRLLGVGLPNKLIAHRMALKEGTVKVHMRNLMRKLGVSSRTQAALLASRYLPADYIEE